MLRTKLIILALAVTFISVAQAQKKNDQADAYVDKGGILRWRKTNAEVCAFGVNYTAMFAHAYRTAKKMNVSLEKAIEDDVYHFSRLGLDAFRVHVWDVEISDTVGNLLNNDHLKLFDFAIARMKERGMKFVITPIAYWGNGYPEPDDKTPGFAAKYGKDACLVDPGAIRAQENYLAQFLSHVNSYTGKAYKDDPDVIAFEVSNEPHHKGTPAEVTTFITRMVESMRKTGCTKPILYNISHSIHLADAYYKAPIQGGTFQWYPTGLGARHELGGNMLPNVDQYVVPFRDLPGYKRTTKIVYEFDAADIGRSYIYPAMSRSFRTAGMQFATHFAYDPTFMASTNTEYNTHYMNLVYAPQKGLSLKIASEVFHKIPLNKSYGTYPADTVFEGFRVSYAEDLAEMITPENFLYTNNTKSKISSVQTLQHIAGFGTSQVVEYKGAGAYFIDRLEAGVWRLEVMPDAVWIRDPYRRSGPGIEVSQIQWNEWPMTLSLPDLGSDFEIKSMNDGNSHSSKVSNSTFNIRPGTYLVTSKGKTHQWKPESRWENITLKEFAAPESRIENTAVVHEPIQEASEGQAIKIDAKVVSPQRPATVELVVLTNNFRPEVISMKNDGGFRYSASINPSLVKAGFIRYYISVKNGEGCITYPGGVAGRPSDWGYGDEEPYSIAIVPSKSPVYLFNAITDTDQLARQWTRGSTLVPGPGPGTAELSINVEKLYVPDPENRNGQAVADYSFRYFFGQKIEGRRKDVTKSSRLVINGRSLDGSNCKIQVALMLKDGSAFGGVVDLNTESKDHALDLSSLKQVKTVTLPRPYPTFLAYYFDGQLAKFNISDIESIQFSIGPGLSENETKSAHAIGLGSVRLE